MSEPMLVYFFFDEPLDEEYLESFFAALNEWPQFRFELPTDAIPDLVDAPRGRHFDGGYRDLTTGLSFYNDAEHPRNGLELPQFRFSVGEVQFKDVDGDGSGIDRGWEAFGLRPPASAQSTVDDVVAYVRGLYERAVESGRTPLQVYGTHTHFLVTGWDPTTTTPSSLRKGAIHDVDWLHVFPPDVVDRTGRTRLLTAPVWQRTELQDGSIQLVTTPSPYPMDNGYDLRAVERHLGL